MNLHPPCFWCRRPLESKGVTRDHLIPQWACRLFYVQLGHANDRGNIVKACSSCNVAKGGMPPALFHEVRTVAGERKKALVLWHSIQEIVCAQWTEEQGRVSPELRAHIIDEMLKPVPGHEPPTHAPARRATTYAELTEYDPSLLNKANKPARKIGPEKLYSSYSVGSVPPNTVIKVGPASPPFSKNKPLRRLYTIQDHEKPNENLEDVR